MDQKKNNTQIDHPDYYGGKKECISAMREEFGLTYAAGFCICSAYKYLWRSGLKDENPEEQELKKAQWYVDEYNRITGKKVTIEELMWKVIKYK